MTLQEHFGDLTNKQITWIGDFHNMCLSWMEAAEKLGFTLRLSVPEAYQPDPSVLQQAAARGAKVEFFADPAEAAGGADCIMTDVWVSISQTDREPRLKAFRPFQVNEALMKRAKSTAVFLHCLPAHRGEEVTDGVIDGPQRSACAAAWCDWGQSSTKSCASMTTRRPFGHWSPRQSVSPPCSAARSSSTESSFCKPRATVRSTCSSPTIIHPVRSGPMHISIQVLGVRPNPPRDPLGNGHLAMTVDQGPDMERYQGIVPLATTRSPRRRIPISRSRNKFRRDCAWLPDP